MFIVKKWFSIKQVKINMKAIETYFFLTHKTNLEADKILCKILKIPYNSNNILLLKEEIKSIGKIDLEKIKNDCAIVGLVHMYDELTPQQITLARQGHDKIICELGNLNILAIRKAFQENAEPFMVLDNISREETLRKLNIQEE